MLSFNAVSLFISNIFTVSIESSLPQVHHETNLKVSRFSLSFSGMEESVRFLSSSRKESKPLTIVVTGCNRYVEYSDRKARFSTVFIGICYSNICREASCHESNVTRLQRPIC